MSATSTQRLIVIIGLCIATAIFTIDFGIVNTALPAIQHDLKMDFVQLRWVMDALAIAVCTFMITMGRIGDIMGRVRLLKLSMLGFILASLIAGLAIDPTMLIVGRALQGIAIAALFPTSLVVMTLLYPEEEKAKAVSYWAGSMGLGLAAGPVLGGFIVGIISWRWIFLLNVPFCLLSLLLCVVALRIQESKQQTQIDWWGFILLALAILGITTAILEEPHWGYQSPLFISMLSAGVLLVLIFYWVEKRVASPVIDFKIFNNRTFVNATIITVMNGFLMYTSFFFLPLYLHHILNYDAIAMGLSLIPITITIALCSPIIARLLRKYSAKRMLYSGFCLLVIAFLILGLLAQQEHFAWMMVAFVCFGVGWGATYNVSTNLALAAVPKASAGVASGLFITCRNGSGAIGLAISGIVYEHTSHHSMSPGAFSSHGFQVVMWLLCGISAAVFLLTLRLQKTRQQTVA